MLHFLLWWCREGVPKWGMWVPILLNLLKETQPRWNLSFSPMRLTPLPAFTSVWFLIYKSIRELICIVYAKKVVAVCKKQQTKGPGYKSENIWIRKFKSKGKFCYLSYLWRRKRLEKFKIMLHFKGTERWSLKKQRHWAHFFPSAYKNTKKKKVRYIAIAFIPCQMVKYPCVLSLSAPHVAWLSWHQSQWRWLYLILIPFCFLDLPLGKPQRFLLFQDSLCN